MRKSCFWANILLIFLLQVILISPLELNGINSEQEEEEEEEANYIFSQQGTTYPGGYYGDTREGSYYDYDYNEKNSFINHLEKVKTGGDVSAAPELYTLAVPSATLNGGENKQVSPRLVLVSESQTTAHTSSSSDKIASSPNQRTTSNLLSLEGEDAVTITTTTATTRNEVQDGGYQPPISQDPQTNRVSIASEAKQTENNDKSPTSEFITSSSAYHAALPSTKSVENEILNTNGQETTTSTTSPPPSSPAVEDEVTNDAQHPIEERLKKMDEDEEEYARCVETVFQGSDHVGPPPAGRYGMPGVPGRHGIPGIPGIMGPKGEPGENCDCSKCSNNDQVKDRKIKQCVWDRYNFALSLGQVQSCTFTKSRKESYLRMEWYGSARIVCPNGPCCNRWYFKIDGSECKDPQPIDGLIYLDSGNTLINEHRAMSVVGICEGISEGIRDISLWIGECSGGYVRGRARTGWNSSSRIVIEEF